MPSGKQYITALLFAALIAFPLLSIVLLQSAQLYLQHEARERLEKQSLQTLTLSRSELYWEKPGKEILVNGKLFDVKTIRYRGSQVFVTGLYDEQETGIVRLLHHQSAHSKRSGRLIHLFSVLQQFVSAGVAATWLLPPVVNHLRSILPLIKYCSPTLSITTPPPRRLQRA